MDDTKPTDPAHTTDTHAAATQGAATHGAAPAGTSAAAPVAGAADDPDKTKILITYILYLPGILLAVILPFIFKGKGSAFAEGHYQNQISIAWRGFVLAIAAAVLSFILGAIGVGFIGSLLSLAAWIWVVIRSVKGLMALTSGKPATDAGWSI